MAKVLTDEQWYSDIADAIREKLKVTKKYRPSQMAGAIKSIITGEAWRCPRQHAEVSFMYDTYKTNISWGSSVHTENV